MAPFDAGMQGKGLFVFLLCCTEPEIGRFLLEDLNVARDCRKKNEGEKVPSFMGFINKLTPCPVHNS